MDQLEPDIRISHGEAFEGFTGVLCFGARRFQEFQAGGRGIEQVADFDLGALRVRGRNGFRFLAAIDGNGKGIGLFVVLRAAGDGQAADGADRGQSLPPKAERGDMHKVVIRQFGGRVALDGQGKVLRRHAHAVVGHGHQAGAAFADKNLDTRGAGINGIFDEFLDGRSGALNDFAGGNLVDKCFR
jgi:hypothetical protein